VGLRSGAGVVQARGDTRSSFAGAPGSRHGIFPTLVGAGEAAGDGVVRRRNGRGPGTPPADPPATAHRHSPTIPSHLPQGGGNGALAGAHAAHSSAGSRSLPPGGRSTRDLPVGREFRCARPPTPGNGPISAGSGCSGRRGADPPCFTIGCGGGSNGVPTTSALIGAPAYDGGRDILPGHASSDGPQAALRSCSLAASTGTRSTSGAGEASSGLVTCDKCDGRHSTDRCPHYKGDREKHKDAWVNYGRKGGPHQMGSSGGNYVMKCARVVRQPGDGSCLFHSLNHGLASGDSAQSLRREIAGFLEKSPTVQIAGDTIEEWVRWDSNSSVADYARRMALSGWGGGIEMAACSLLKNVNVHVYENASRRGSSNEFKRISCFDCPNAARTIHVLYQGGVHYDALVPLHA